MPFGAWGHAQTPSSPGAVQSLLRPQALEFEDDSDEEDEGEEGKRNVELASGTPAC
jgi:hypothetical protein